jgi:hypothetical protein
LPEMFSLGFEGDYDAALHEDTSSMEETRASERAITKSKSGNQLCFRIAAALSLSVATNHWRAAQLTRAGRILICNTGMNIAIRTSLVVLSCTVVAGCGAPGSGQLANRELVAVSVFPSPGAQSLPPGQVQFAGVASYSQPPSPVPLTNAPEIMWCVGNTDGHCLGFVIPDATIDSSGLAKCRPGFSGFVTVLAGQPEIRVPQVPDTGIQLSVFGKAQLTCP